MHRNWIATVALASTLGLAGSLAQAKVYDVSTLDGSQGWQSGDTRAGGSVQLTTLGGRDALVLTTDSSIDTSAQAKAQAYIQLDQPIPFRYFGGITMEWYRDSSSSSDNMGQMPGLRLIVQNSNGDIGQLVWEWAENTNAPLVEDTWVSQSLTTGPNNLFWVYSGGHNFFAAPVTVNDGEAVGTPGNYRQTLEFWQKGGTVTDASGTSVLFDDMSSIVGLSISMGSGVDGYFMGGISQLQYGYMNSYPGGRPVKPSSDTINFHAEVLAEPVPEPASAALGVMALAGLGLACKRRRA